MSLLLALSLRGTLAFLLVEGADRLAARFGQAYGARRLAWLLAALAFLVPVHLPLPRVPKVALPALPAAFDHVFVMHPDVSEGRVSALHRHLSWSQIAVPFWGAGVLGFLAVAAVQTVAAQRRWARERLCTDSRLLGLLEDVKAEAGVTAPIGLVVSPRVPAPALLGWLRPRLLLSADLAAALPPERLRAILLHELAHFRALDLPANLLFTLVRAAHWFNPFAWIAARSWARFREEAADAAALRWMEGDPAYGETLLETLQRASAPVPYGAVGMGESLRNLKWRLTMIARYRNASRPAWALILPALLALALAAFPLPAQTNPPSAANSEQAAKDTAVAAMLDWLELENNGDYGASWDQASKGFQKSMTRDAWIAVSEKVGRPLGKCLGRTLASAEHDIDTPMANGQVRKGEFVLAQFDTSFENLKYAVETVCFQKEADGKWRSAGYLIHAK